ncbi:MAG: hypothetical protein CMJ49_12330 [Planctomycetaceae bacterium]|nr:hypothetical protein [Planctomycetaceae bacterium]
MTPHLSPPDHHKHLTSQIAPDLAFDDTDPPRWRRRLRRKLRQLLGDTPTQRCPLRPRTIWKLPHPLGSIEKIIFTAEPRADVVAYVCLPKDVPPPHTFMICLQGHTTGMHNSIAVRRDDETRRIKVQGDRDFGLGCMRRGIAALCVEQRSFGERRDLTKPNPPPIDCHAAAMHALMLGRTLIGERVYDVDRAIDYLTTRGDAETKRIGLMGHSGGGTVTIFAAALLSRIAFAMPSGAFCTFRESIMAISCCVDNYIPGLLKHAEMADVLGLFAPRPLVVVHGTDDHFFPVRGTRRAFRDLRQIYDTAEAKSRCHLVIANGGHRFYADNAWPVMLNEINRI